MIGLLAVIFRLFLRRGLVEAAVRQARSDVHGSGWRAMPRWTCPSPPTVRLLAATILRRQAFTAISHFFVSDIAMLWRDIGARPADLGLRWRPGFPRSWWASRVSPSTIRCWPKIVGPLVGPLVAMLHLRLLGGQCAAWLQCCGTGRRRASAGLDRLSIRRSDRAADPRHLPPLLRLAERPLFCWVAFYVAMALSAYAVEFIFGALHLTPASHPARASGMGMEFAWDYTTWLNLALLVPTAILVCAS